MPETSLKFEMNAWDSPGGKIHLLTISCGRLSINTLKELHEGSITFATGTIQQYYKSSAFQQALMPHN